MTAMVGAEDEGVDQATSGKVGGREGAWKLFPGDSERTV